MNRPSTKRELAKWMDELSRKVGSGIRHQVRGPGRGQHIVPVAVKPKIQPKAKIDSSLPVFHAGPTFLREPEIAKPEIQTKFVVTLAGHEGRGRRRKPILFYVLSVWENEKGAIAGVRYAPKSSEAFLFSKLRAEEIHSLCIRQGMRPAVHPVEVTNGAWTGVLPNVWEQIWNGEVR